LKYFGIAVRGIFAFIVGAAPLFCVSFAMQTFISLQMVGYAEESELAWRSVSHAVLVSGINLALLLVVMAVLVRVRPSIVVAQNGPALLLVCSSLVASLVNTFAFAVISSPEMFLLAVLINFTIALFPALVILPAILRTAAPLPAPGRP
jgi:hypothetical protein